jgi:hypothetical protein
MTLSMNPRFVSRIVVVVVAVLVFQPRRRAP